MPRTITVHTASLAAGLGLGAVLILALGAAQLGQPVPKLPRVRVDGIAAPYQMVRLVAADFPYTVPANHTLVITGVGQLQTTSGLPPAGVSIRFAAQEVIYVSTMLSENATFSSPTGGAVVAIAPGLAAPGGTAVTAVSPPSSWNAPFVILGYLAPQ